MQVDIQRTALIALFSVFAFSPAAGVFAQSVQPEVQPGVAQLEEILGTRGKQYSTPSELSSCFDYYTFNSVHVDFVPSLHTVSAGSPIVFSGTITNNNPYPIVNANVWVKIFRDRGDPSIKDPNGPDVVDWINVAGPLTLKAGESQPISFFWNAPQKAQSGNYYAAAYVVSSDRFNLNGLTFTDDVTGSLSGFSVVGGQAGAVSFDKTSIKVGGMPFYFAAYPPRVSSTSAITITGSVVNTTLIPSKGSITWSLYSWDALRPNALIEQTTQEVKVHPNSSTLVSYTVNNAAYPVYYLVGELTVNGTKSIVGIRFVRTGIDEPRINFAGVTSYPLTSDSKLFMCVHNTNNGEAQDSAMTVVIVPTDPVERAVDQILGRTPILTYAGVIPSQIVALAGSVKANPTSFDVVTRLYQHGVLVDEVNVPYRCTDLGTPCGLPYSYALGALLLVLILLVAALYRIVNK